MATAEIASSPINSRDLKTFLKEMIRAGLSVLIKGSPGTGKTEIVKQAAAEAPAECMVTFPGMDDPTDDKGLGAVDIENHRAEFLPFGNFERALNAIGRFVWFMDDFGTAAQLVQATKGQLVQGRELNGKRLPDGVTFIVATNDRTDRSAVSGIIEMFKGRMTIVELKPEYNHWIEDYAMPVGIHPAVISYIRDFGQDAFYDFKPTADLTNSPTGRGWKRVSDIMTKCTLSPSMELAAFKGSVGAGRGSEFYAYRERIKSMPSPDGIILNPMSAPIPLDDMSVLWATVVCLAAKANKTNFGQIIRYGERLELEADKAQMATVLIKYCLNRDQYLIATKAGMELSNSGLQMATAFADAHSGKI